MQSASQSPTDNPITMRTGDFRFQQAGAIYLPHLGGSFSRQQEFVDWARKTGSNDFLARMYHQNPEIHNNRPITNA